jgi:hypothetical protein
MATRTAKLLPHLWNRPEHIIYVPAFILFGYYFAIMKVYALLTLHEVCFPMSLARFVNRMRLQTGWGTRAGVGDPSKAMEAAEASEGSPNEKLHEQKDYRYQQPHIHQRPMEMQTGYAIS